MSENNQTDKGKHVALIATDYSYYFAEKVWKYLGEKKDISASLERIQTEFFNDGNRFVKLPTSVSGNNVYLIQTSILGNPVLSDYDTFCICDALRRSHARSYSILNTYSSCARQDTKKDGRVTVTMKMYADILNGIGASMFKRYVTCHLHSEQCTAFFNRPADNLESVTLFSWLLRKRFPFPPEEIVFGRVDVGANDQNRKVSSYFNGLVLFAVKERIRPGEARVQTVSDLSRARDRVVVLLDDIVDTAGTVVENAGAFLENGAKEVVVMPTHFVGSARRDSDGRVHQAEEKIRKAGFKLITTDTLFRPDSYYEENRDWFLGHISMAPICAEEIYKDVIGESDTSLFKNYDGMVELLDNAFRKFPRFNRLTLDGLRV